MIPFPIIATLLSFISLCVVIDVRSRRIPNALSGCAMLCGAALNTFYFGGEGLVASLSGLTAAVVVLFGPFALGGVGAGDVKMMGAVGALLGPRLALIGLLAGMVLGGLIMTVALARRGRLEEKLAATISMIAGTAVTRSLSPLKRSAAEQSAVALPYSVPLGIGTMAVLAMGCWG